MTEFEAGYEQKITVNWTIPQGADTTVAVRPYTLTDPNDPASVRIYEDYSTGWTARAQIRKKAGQDPWVVFSSADAAGPRIELGADGWIRVVLPAATTEDVAWDAYKEGFWDLELVDSGGAVTREVAGAVTVSHDITRTVA